MLRFAKSTSPAPSPLQPTNLHTRNKETSARETPPALRRKWSRPHIARSSRKPSPASAQDGPRVRRSETGYRVQTALPRLRKHWAPARDRRLSQHSFRCREPRFPISSKPAAARSQETCCRSALAEDPSVLRAHRSRLQAASSESGPPTLPGGSPLHPSTSSTYRRSSPRSNVLCFRPAASQSPPTCT